MGLICVLTLLLPLFDKHIVCMSKVSVSIVLEVAKSLKLWWRIWGPRWWVFQLLLLQQGSVLFLTHYVSNFTHVL